MTYRARQYRLTRDLPQGTPGSSFPRNLEAGELLYQCTAPYAASLAGDDGVMLTEDADGGYPGFEVPASAVEEAPAGICGPGCECRCGIHGHAGPDAIIPPCCAVHGITPAPGGCDGCQAGLPCAGNRAGTGSQS